MASNMLDSLLYRNVFSTPEMRELFDDKTIMQNWLDLEKALAQTQAELGIIPKEAADEICRKGFVENLDIAAIEEGINKIGHSLVPTLRCFEKICDKGYGEYIHLGATTQDILDTGFMMSIKKGFNVILRDLFDTEAAILSLVDKYAGTIMAGRTHKQQALPITFGYKAAVWASELRRGIERMKDCKKRCFTGQLSGAVGTMAGFGSQAVDISNCGISRVGLDIPDIAWHSSRDRLAELVSVLAIVSGTLGKIGNEIAVMQMTEISELAEGFTEGAVGSSTMPHKRNPTAPETIHMLGHLIRAAAAATFESMFSTFERDGALWKIEWKTVNETVIMAGAIAAKSKKLLSNLTVNPERMKKNLDLLKGLMLSEPVMLVLGEKIGKQTAHELVYQISMKAFETNADFCELLLQNREVSGNLSRTELEKILDPEGYTGQSIYFARKVYSDIMAARKKDGLDAE
jgi:adenylosuccinate lyase